MRFNIYRAILDSIYTSIAKGYDPQENNLTNKKKGHKQE